MYIKRPGTSFSAESVTHKIFDIWNHLSNELKNTHKRFCFKSKIKNDIIDKCSYNIDCHNPTCRQCVHVQWPLGISLPDIWHAFLIILSLVGISGQIKDLCIRIITFWSFTILGCGFSCSPFWSVVFHCCSIREPFRVMCCLIFWWSIVDFLWCYVSVLFRVTFVILFSTFTLPIVAILYVKFKTVESTK